MRKKFSLWIIIFVALVSLTGGYLAGDHRILNPGKDADLVNQGTAAGISFIAGMILERQGETELAKEKYQEALELNPDLKEIKELAKQIAPKND